MKNILWYTRDGHLDFFALLSKKLGNKDNRISSYYICHTEDESDSLKKKYQIEPAVLSTYLNNKKNIEINEKQIQKLEKKYNCIPLRRLLWSEMYEKNFSEEELIIHLAIHFEFWENVLRDKKIDGVVSERPSILSTSVLWVVCKQNNISFVDFINIGLDGRIIFNSSWYGDIDDFEHKYRNTKIDKNTIDYKRSLRYLEKMQKKIEKPEYIFKNLNTGKKITKRQLYQELPSLPKLSSLLKIRRNIDKFKERKSYYRKANKYDRLSIWFKAFIRKSTYKFYHFFETDVDTSKEKYFLFTLHILHEWSNYPWMGLKYPMIINLIEECSANLPLGCKLYVKEHTTNFPEKPFSFYHKIKKIPRVKLIDPHENTFDLLRNAEAIITLGGTIGWESFLLGKPVIIFGETWYKDLPGINKVDNNMKLAELLQNAKDLPLASEKEKIRAIYVLTKLSFQAERYPVVDLISTENIEKYIKPFENWINNKV